MSGKGFCHSCFYCSDSYDLGATDCSWRNQTNETSIMVKTCPLNYNGCVVSGYIASRKF